MTRATFPLPPDDHPPGLPTLDLCSPGDAARPLQLPHPQLINTARAGIEALKRRHGRAPTDTGDDQCKQSP